MRQTILNGHQPIHDIQVYYEFYPNPSAQKTIVLLHGFLSSSFTFRHLIPLLNRDFQVLSVDLPPFGKSEKSSRYVYSYKNIARTIIELISFFSLTDVIFVGHSMGGQIVLNILYFMPELAEKAVLLSSSAYLRRAKKSLILSSYLPYFHLVIKRWLASTGVEQNLQDSIYNHSLINKEMIDGYLQPFLQNEIFVALTRMIRHREGDLPTDSLKQIKTPCLLIWGEHDKSVPLNIGEQLTKDLLNSRLIVLKETGHAIPEERPKEVYQHIKNFLGDSLTPL